MDNGGRRLRVYVVEDSALLLSRLLEVLEGLGVKIVGHADNAPSAIREILAAAPDLVIIDIALRRGSGFDVLRMFAQRNDISPPVRIVLSNYTSKPYRDAAKRLGVEYYFDKNSEFGSMLEIVTAMVRERGKRNGSTDDTT